MKKENKVKREKGKERRTKRKLNGRNEEKKISNEITLVGISMNLIGFHAHRTNWLELNEDARVL
jgi:hypothetical protein